MNYAIAAVITLAAWFVYHYRTKISNFFRTEVNAAVTKGSAFARVAEQEGKLIALKTTTAVKKEAALAVHAALDEIDGLLG